MRTRKPNQRSGRQAESLSKRVSYFVNDRRKEQVGVYRRLQENRRRFDRGNSRQNSGLDREQGNRRFENLSLGFGRDRQNDGHELPGKHTSDLR